MPPSEGIPRSNKKLCKSNQINPDNPDAILQWALHMTLRRNRFSTDDLSKVNWETSPGYLKAYDHKSTLLMKLDRYHEASKVLHNILKLNPEYYRAYAGIGICFDKLGKRADAQRYYRKFLSLKPFSHQAQFVKARLEKIKNNNKSSMPFSVCS